MYTRTQMIIDLVELSTIRYDIENIIQEADHFGDEPRSLAQDVADNIAFAWNRMTRDDPKFNDMQDRLHNLRSFITKDRS